MNDNKCPRCSDGKVFEVNDEGGWYVMCSNHLCDYRTVHAKTRMDARVLYRDDREFKV